MTTPIYKAAFDFKSTFNPATLTVDTNNQYLLAYPQNAPPYWAAQGAFCVLLPGGAKRLDLLFFAPQSVRMGCVVRAGKPPECDYSQVKVRCWNQYPWDQDAKGTLSVMQSRDMRFRNSGGHGYIMQQVFQASPTPIWIYVLMLGGAYHFQYNCFVDADKYQTWWKTQSLPAITQPQPPTSVWLPTSECTGEEPDDAIGGEIPPVWTPLDIFNTYVQQHIKPETIKDPPVQSRVEINSDASFVLPGTFQGVDFDATFVYDGVGKWAIKNLIVVE